MLNSLVCTECKGSRAVAYSYEYKPIGDTGLQDWTLIPQGPPDDALLAKVLPDVVPPGYRLNYAVELIQWRGRETKVRRLFMEKDPNYSATDISGPRPVNLAAMSKEELVELAVRKGVTAADMTWGKARLIAEIEKATK